MTHEEEGGLYKAREKNKSRQQGVMHYSQCLSTKRKKKATSRADG